MVGQCVQFWDAFGWLTRLRPRGYGPAEAVPLFDQFLSEQGRESIRNTQPALQSSIGIGQRGGGCEDCTPGRTQPG